jgi:hypothetical protein
MNTVKLKFSIYVCKGVPAWGMGGDLSYLGRCCCLIFSFQINDLFSFRNYICLDLHMG